MLWGKQTEEALMPKKFSHFIFILTFALSISILLTLSLVNANQTYHDEIAKLQKKGHTKPDNQLAQISHDLSIITNY